MIGEPTILFRRAKHIMQTEGMIPLLRQVFTFLTGYFFWYETYYVYEHRLDEGSVSDFLPQNRGFTLKIFSTNKQADELVADGFEFSSPDDIGRKRLDKGAIAFCMFVEQQLVHISWVAMTQQAKDTDTDIPLPVDFSNNEAYLGWTAKNPNHLRASRGFPVHVYFQIMKFLRQRGITACRFMVQKRNAVTQNILAKRIPIQPCGEGHYLKLFSWKSWKEKPLASVGR